MPRTSPQRGAATFALVGLIVGFDTLEDVLGALQFEACKDLATASEQLAPAHYLFECREL